VGLSGHLPYTLRVRKERPTEFRGAVAAPLGKISDVANSMAVTNRAVHPRQKLGVTRGTPASPAPRPRTRPTQISNPIAQSVARFPFFPPARKNARSCYGYGDALPSQRHDLTNQEKRINALIDAAGKRGTGPAGFVWAARRCRLPGHPRSKRPAAGLDRMGAKRRMD